MTRMWSLRQLLGKAWDKAPERNVAAESASPARLIEFGDFKIDLAQRTVTLCDQELLLNSEEFDVLVFLASHPQRLVTPHTVLATSWTTNQHRQTEFLKVLVSLRKKLDIAGHGRHYLRTEPWVLYRFDPASSSAA